MGEPSQELEELQAETVSSMAKRAAAADVCIEARRKQR